MSAFDLWLDGPEMEQSAGWREEVKFDFDRFASDDHYAQLVSDHISRTLANLSREIEEIGVQLPISECARE